MTLTGDIFVACTEEFSSQYFDGPFVRIRFRWPAKKAYDNCHPRPAPMLALPSSNSPIDSLHGLASLRTLYGIRSVVRGLRSWQGLGNIVSFEYTPLQLPA